MDNLRRLGCILERSPTLLFDETALVLLILLEMLLVLLVLLMLLLVVTLSSLFALMLVGRKSEVAGVIWLRGFTIDSILLLDAEDKAGEATAGTEEYEWRVEASKGLLAEASRGL